MVTTQVQEGNEPVANRQSQELLQLHGICAGYGKREVLQGVSLTVERGDIVAIIGTNGAGKSTLLKVIAGLLPAWQGKIVWDGREITTMSVDQRIRTGIGYLMQSGNIFPSLSVGENLEMGLQALRNGERRQTRDEVLELFADLRQRLHHRAGLLSGGQRQMLALAMVLCQRPQLMLLDEPSAGLAPKLAQEMLQRVRELNQRMGVAILLVEQRVREALEMARRAVVLRNGVVALHTDQPAALLQDDRLEQLLLTMTRT